jgi:hypothetical protein
MSAGAGTRAFRDWDLKHRLEQLRALAAGPAPFALLAVIIVVVACSIRLVLPRYGGITYEPAFTGHTAQQPGVGYRNLGRLKRQLAAKIDQQRVATGVWVTGGDCVELTSAESAMCEFSGSDGSTATITAYISEDGSRYWTPVSDSP